MLANKTADKKTNSGRVDPIDKATPIGLVLGVGLILISIAIGGGGLMPFVDVPSIMIVFGGSIAATLINFPLAKVLSVFSVVKNCFFVKLPEPKEAIATFSDLSAVARRDGLLALEAKMEAIDDPFLKRGLELVVGGSTKEEITASMETELAYIEQRHGTGKKIVDSIGAAAPAFGMIGTLIGLVQMLRSLDDPSNIGAGMAVALLTTLYGAVVANLFCIPLAGKLETKGNEETLIRELMITGLQSSVEGHAPRATEERLLAFLSQGSRTSSAAQQAA